jgi:hypothetical protein
MGIEDLLDPHLTPPEAVRVLGHRAQRLGDPQERAGVRRWSGDAPHRAAQKLRAHLLIVEEATAGEDDGLACSDGHLTASAASAARAVGGDTDNLPGRIRVHVLDGVVGTDLDADALGMADEQVDRRLPLSRTVDTTGLRHQRAPVLDMVLGQL